MSPVNIKELEYRQLVAKTTGEKLSLTKALTATYSLKGLSVHYETLLPGRKASSPHYHTRKEELVFVLEGNPSVWLNGEIKKLAPGDFFGFSSEANYAHMVINESDSPAVFLSIGTNPRDDEVIYV